MPRAHLIRIVWACWLTLAVTGCVGQRRITRMADGVTYEGRFISPQAYAAYARGAALEGRGEFPLALAAFQVALELDPRSPEILARIGALHCRFATRVSDAAARRAQAALRRATTLDPEHATAWAETARCRARLREPEAALEAARKAARADPDSLPLQFLVIDLAEANGSVDTARAWLDALVVQVPESREAWQKLYVFARRQRDTGRSRRAARALGALHQTADAEAELLRALLDDELVLARRMATELRIGAGELAARAALAGAWAAAREQAEFVLAADPSDIDAWIALLVVQELRQDQQWSGTLRGAPLTPSGRPGPAARRLQGELLERRVGPEARRAWEAAF